MSQNAGNSRSTRQNPSLQTPSNEPERALRQRQRAQQSPETRTQEATSSTPLPGQPAEDNGNATSTQRPSSNQSPTPPSLQPRQLRLVTPRNRPGVQNAPSASTDPTEELDVTQALTRHTTFHTASQAVGNEVQDLLQQVSVDLRRLPASDLESLPTAFETLIQTPPESSAPAAVSAPQSRNQSPPREQRVFEPPPPLPVRQSPTGQSQQSNGASQYGTPQSDLHPEKKMAAVLDRLITDTVTIVQERVQHLLQDEYILEQIEDIVRAATDGILSHADNAVTMGHVISQTPEFAETLQSMVDQRLTSSLQQQLQPLVGQEVRRLRAVETTKVNSQARLSDWLRSNPPPAERSIQSVSSGSSRRAPPRQAPRPAEAEPSDPGDSSDSSSSSSSSSTTQDADSADDHSVQSESTVSRATSKSSYHPDGRKKTKETSAEFEERLKKDAKEAERLESKDKLERLRPINPLYKKAVDFRTYRLMQRSAEYTTKMESRTAKTQQRVEIRMQKQVFSGTDPIAILNFLKTFKDACDGSNVNEGAAMWLFQYFLTSTAKTLVTQRLKQPGTTAKQRAKDRKEKKLTSYAGVVNLLLHEYASDDIIAKAHSDLATFRIIGNMSETAFATKLQAKATRCGGVYPDSTIKTYFVDGIHPDLRDTVRSYIAQNPNKSLQSVARHAQSMSKFRNNTDQSSSRNERRDSRDTRDSRNRDNRSDSRRDNRGSRNNRSDRDSKDTRKSASSSNSHQSSTNKTSVNATEQQKRCRLCLGDHDTGDCPNLSAAERKKLIDQREKNYQNIRKTNIGKRTNSPKPSAAGSSSKTPSVSFVDQDSEDSEASSETEN